MNIDQIEKVIDSLVEDDVPVSGLRPDQWPQDMTPLSTTRLQFNTYQEYLIDLVRDAKAQRNEVIARHQGIYQGPGGVSGALRHGQHYVFLDKDQIDIITKLTGKSEKESIDQLRADVERYNVHISKGKSSDGMYTVWAHGRYGY